MSIKEELRKEGIFILLLSYWLSGVIFMSKCLNILQEIEIFPTDCNIYVVKECKNADTKKLSTTYLVASIWMAKIHCISSSVLKSKLFSTSMHNSAKGSSFSLTSATGPPRPSIQCSASVVTRPCTKSGFGRSWLIIAVDAKFFF